MLLFKSQQTYHHTPFRMANIEKIDNTKCWQDAESPELLGIASGNENSIFISPNPFTVSYRIKYTIMYESVMSAVGIYPGRVKGSIQTKM